jgi:hypothetical protein
MCAVVVVLAWRCARRRHHRVMEPKCPAVIMLAPCALPNPDVASSLPWFIRPGDVICLSDVIAPGRDL